MPKVVSGVWTIGDDLGGNPGGGGLTAAGITAISAAPDESVHSNAVFPGVFNGVLEKFSFANLIALVRSTVGLGRQINPTGKLPVLRADGEDFHYQLENPATLPSVASNAPTNPDLMNAAIIYKDTAEGETANELYYKRKHDRESVIITFNDTSPRSFGTDYRSFGWTAHIIPDVAEPTPGNHPYPSVPTHWNAFMRVISISQGTYQWRLYADAAFSGLGTLYLDMRANGDDQDFIQNVALTKAGADSYWASEAYAEADFPFRVLSSRSERTRIRIRKADNTLSDSIIHLIPVDDVREALVDEDRLHSVYADILDLMAQHLDNVGGGGPSTYTLLATGDPSNIRTGFSFKAAMVVAMRAAWNTSHHFELRFKLSTAQYATREIWTIPQPLPSTAIQVYAGIATSDTGQPRVVDFTLTPTTGSVSTGVDNSWPKVWSMVACRSPMPSPSPG